MIIKLHISLNISSKAVLKRIICRYFWILIFVLFNHRFVTLVNQKFLFENSCTSKREDWNIWNDIKHFL